eukprot:CAMPEP_0170364806 /NCGR_PEP_ID=MMETSP0117_2-20130122/5574_1 /TAXON_ID=400756 /ORGANISM="Durinskia baltica, Strain CSIRO CS-38" /LENGTH=282 /DNA_ID=CAMNT_0010619339 /DNA_START=90 /DNA_END=938 /DNA_ORIENTATION=+
MALRRIFVTGGNKGIGQAICEKLIKEYPDTFVYLGSRDASRGEEAIASIVSNIGGSSASRLELVVIDVGDDASVSTAASELTSKIGANSLYGIVNNAGIGWGNTLEDMMNVNVFGVQRVTNAFLPLLHKSTDPLSTGRIVNIASASGPTFIAKLREQGVDYSALTSATSWSEVEAFFAGIKSSISSDGDAYGISKACLNIYTIQFAKAHPEFLINSCTPGFIQTDLTKGFGATNTPEMGTVSTMHCLFAPDAGSGRYYGSDAKRSPIDRYRGPGEAPYEPEE